MTYANVLEFLTTPDGVKTAIAVFITLALQLLPAWADMPIAKKKWVIAMITFGVPFLAVILGHFTLDWSLEWPGRLWLALCSGATIFFGAIVPEGTKVATGIQIRSPLNRNVL